MSADDTLPPRDAHLARALRHAPDAADVPPPALDAHILQAARRAVAPAPWWRRAASTLAGAWATWGQPRHAAVLGGLAVAGVIAVVWQADAPPPATEPAARDAAVVPAPVSPAGGVAKRAPAGTRQATAAATAERGAPLTRHAAPPPPPPPAMAESRAMAPAPTAPDPLAPAIARLQAASAPAEVVQAWTRWRDQAARTWQPAPTAAGTPPGTPLSASDGTELGRVWFEPDAVLWQADGDRTRWRAPMDRAAREHLRASLGLPAR